MRYGKLAVLLAAAPLLGAQVTPKTGISGPYAHENLSIFLIHRGAAAWAQGGARASTVAYLTLEQAVNQKKVVVHETDHVNQLAVENLSSDTVFLQAGDIVQGGKQDRMITNDFILGPHSGNLPLAAFCIEQGRWGRRGNESVAAFVAPAEMGAVAFDPRSSWNQMSVWNAVASLQDALASHLRKQQNATGLSAIRAPASPTSLLLTQKSRPVQEEVREYTKKLAGITTGKTDVVGYALVLNGAVKKADVYGSPELFSAVWPKLLKASIVEAMRSGRAGSGAGDANTVAKFLSEANGVRATQTAIDGRTHLVLRDGARQESTETLDRGAWVHRSAVKK